MVAAGMDIARFNQYGGRRAQRDQGNAKTARTLYIRTELGVEIYSQIFEIVKNKFFVYNLIYATKHTGILYACFYFALIFIKLNLFFEFL